MTEGRKRVWTSERDRRRAALQATKLTPAQAAQKTHREKVFNAGFDAAIRNATPKEVLRMVRFDHPQYLDDRKQLFEQWDLDQRLLQEGI